MNYVDRGAFGMDRAGTPAELGRPDAARAWRPCGFFGETEILECLKLSWDGLKKTVSAAILLPCCCHFAATCIGKQKSHLVRSGLII